MLIVWNPERYAAWGLLSKYNTRPQLYVCTVDGERVYRGEELPNGERETIEKWIEERYQLFGVVSVDRHPGSLKWYCTDLFSQRPYCFESYPIRLLASDSGRERIFLLTPTPKGYLTWNGN